MISNTTHCFSCKLLTPTFVINHHQKWKGSSSISFESAFEPVQNTSGQKKLVSFGCSQKIFLGLSKRIMSHIDCYLMLDKVSNVLKQVSVQRLGCFLTFQNDISRSKEIRLQIEEIYFQRMHFEEQLPQISFYQLWSQVSFCSTFNSSYPLNRIARRTFIWGDQHVRM
jgi:hypothetical protein